MLIHYRKLTRGLQRACFVSAFGMTIVVILTGVVPSAGQVFSNQSHWLVHLATFAVLAAAWTCGLPRIPGLIVLLAIIAFALVHEAIEIVGHSHGYETRDVAVDAVGVSVGVWLTRLSMIRCGLK